jgi:hypothetical protein
VGVAAEGAAAALAGEELLAALSVSGRKLLARLIAGEAVMGASAAMAEEAPKSERLERLLDAITLAVDFEQAGSLDPGRFTPEAEQRSGGVGPSDYEKAIKKAAETLSSEFVSLYAVRVGQGDEVLDDSATHLLKTLAADWLTRCIGAYGLDEFLELFGSSEFNEKTAAEMASVIFQSGQVFADPQTGGNLFALLAMMDLEDVVESLPEDADEDGEADE